MRASVRRLRSGDFAWAERLLRRSHHDRLSPDQRAEHGFVQGQWSVATIAEFSQGPGAFVAEVDDVPVGLALTSAPGAATGGPAGRLNELAAQRYGARGYFLYGPVVVDEDHRRQGVLRVLFGHLRTALSADYPVGVAFVEDGNVVSLAVHHRLGMQEFATYAVGERTYHALSFPTLP